jgi:hypothetical protein
MRRDQLLLGEMIEAADRAHQLTGGISVEELQADRLRAESLLWNFTVLSEAAAQLSDELKARFPDVPGSSPPACGTGSCTATGPLTWRSCIPRPPTSSRPSRLNCAPF